MKLYVLNFLSVLDEVFSETLHAKSVESEFDFVKFELGKEQITFNYVPNIYFSLKGMFFKQLMRKNNAYCTHAEATKEMLFCLNEFRLRTSNFVLCF